MDEVGVVAVKSDISTITTDIVHVSSFSANSTEFDFQETGGVPQVVEHIFLFDCVLYLTVLKKLGNIHILSEFVNFRVGQLVLTSGEET